MSENAALVKYLEVGYRMRLWVARGRPDVAAEIFKRLEPEMQSFRAFRRIKQAIVEDEHGWSGRLERMFDPSRLLEKSSRRKFWNYRRRQRERYGVREGNRGCKRGSGTRD